MLNGFQFQCVQVTHTEDLLKSKGNETDVSTVGTQSRGRRKILNGTCDDNLFKSVRVCGPSEDALVRT